MADIGETTKFTVEIIISNEGGELPSDGDVADLIFNRFNDDPTNAGIEALSVLVIDRSGDLDSVPLDEDGEPTPCGEPHDDLSGLCGNCHGGDQVDPGVNGPPKDNRYYDGGRLITPSLAFVESRKPSFVCLCEYIHTGSLAGKSQGVNHEVLHRGWCSKR